MKFSIARDTLIKPLNLVAGVVERRQTLPILSNVLMALDGSRLSLTGTDLEVELVGRLDLAAPGVDGEVTVPARKLVDICKSLPEGSNIEFSVEAGKATVKAGRSRFTLSTLPAADFPTVDANAGDTNLEMPKSLVKQRIEGKLVLGGGRGEVAFPVRGIARCGTTQSLLIGGFSPSRSTALCQRFLQRQE